MLTKIHNVFKSSHAIHLKLIYSAIYVCLYIIQLYFNETEKAVR